ncbi:MAG: hypothetical protein JXB26_04155 [Candidatus Aminicenantes bacterium]|nr:hypothetical protein [Candidatus Aminicenantes bacterium]
MKPLKISGFIALLFFANILIQGALTDIPEFSLKDQFDNPVDHTMLATPTLTVIIAGDTRDTGDQIQAWYTSIKEKTGTSLSIFGLANLKKVPFFISKNSVRKSLRETCPEVRVILDWKGEIYPSFGFGKGGIFLHIYGPEGKLLSTYSGKHTPQTLKQLLELIDNYGVGPCQIIDNK